MSRHGTCCTAEHYLAQAGVPVGSHHHHFRNQIHRLEHKDVADFGAAGGLFYDFGFDTLSRQISGQALARWCIESPEPP